MQAPYQVQLKPRGELVRGVSITKTCARCGDAFVTEWPRKTYCSERCKAGESRCEQCGNSFFSTTGNTSKRFCSRDCWYAFYREHGKVPKDCPVCETVFHGKSSTCSRQCGRLLQRGRHPDRKTACTYCGASMIKALPRQQYCSRTCSARDTGRAGRGTSLPEGTTRRGGKGYRQIKVGKSWPMQHRHIMEQVLGRPLEDHERVHHKNGRRDDNRPENLELWRVQKKDPAGVRAADYHCHGCRCFDV